MGHSEQRTAGFGPFVTRVAWRPGEGGVAVWESRPARKRGTVTVRAAEDAEQVARSADAEALSRLRSLNATAAVAFTAGGALFALGAALDLGDDGATTSASVYFTGGLFFTAGAYVSLLQTINAPRLDSARDLLATHRWRWWSYEPMQIDWLSTFVLFTGTLVFGLNLLDSFLQGLSPQQADRLVWVPDVMGSVLFLISGHLALEEVCHGRPGIRVRDLGWWIVAVDQAGSVMFMIAALAGFTVPGTGDVLDAPVANWGTFGGALCFAAGGVLQMFERPRAGPG